MSIVFSADAYGIQAEKSLKEKLQEFDICVAQSVELWEGMVSSDYDNVISNLRTPQKARVVALYADIKHIQPLMLAVKRQEAYREFIWAGSDSTSIVTNNENENCENLLGSFSVTMDSTPPAGLANYMQQFLLNYQRPIDHSGHHEDIDWEYHSIFEHAYTSEGIMERMNEIARNGTYKHMLTFTTTYAIDAVYAYAYALQDFINTNCPMATGNDAKRCLNGKSLLPFLKAVRFNSSNEQVCFNDKGDFVGRIAVNQCQIQNGLAKQVRVASWDMKKLNFHTSLQWPNDSTTPPKSVCAEPCGIREAYTFLKQTCCWKCVPCQPNEISKQTHCTECPPFSWPNEHTFKTCVPITPTYISIKDVLPLVLAIIATLGLIGSAYTASNFYIYSQERIIRSSSRELSALMMLGVILSFLLQYSILSPPTRITCYCNQVGFSLTLTLVYAPLYVKTNRIYRIFTAGRKSAASPKWTSSASQLLIASFFILIQVMHNISNSYITV